VSIRVANPLAWRALLRPAAGLAICLALAGCLTTPLEDRDWVRVETQNFDVWSSLGADASLRLAIELERFRAANGFLAGRDLPADPLPTRVLAFDDRGIGRPFAYLSQRGYLLARQPGDVLVLRTGGGWEGDAWTPLKLDYARQLIWNASRDAMPPWLDEGLPQVASTIETRDEGAHAGIARSDHVAALRDSVWIPFDRLVGATDLASWSTLERSVFAAESWALCHYLTFREGQRRVPEGAIGRVREQLRQGASPAVAARSELGDLGELQHEVFAVVRAGTFAEGALRIPWSGPRPQVRPVGRVEVSEQLGELALAIGDTELAARFLSKVEAPVAGTGRALAAAGALAHARGESGAADERFAAAIAAAPDDVVVRLHYADLLRARAQSADAAQREALARDARAQYARAIALSAPLAEAHAGFASIHEIDGAEPDASLEHARVAHRLIPGDSEVALLAARLELAIGDRATARGLAARAVTRARSTGDLDAARAVLAQIDGHAERAAIR
jgi:tetratricopeptide (TPR) repeat protein